MVVQDTTGEDERVAPDAWFYPNHVGKFVLFGLVGGLPFFFYWSYRSWKAYAANAGYSRSPFWQRVRQETGYRPSPFWRALFMDAYFLCLFPAVDRECRLRGLRGLSAAVGLPFAYALLLFLNAHVSGVAEKLLFSPMWAVFPVQLAVNRLHVKEGRRLRLASDGWELLWVTLGAFGTLSALAKG